MQYLVVLEVVQQRLRHGKRIGHGVDRGARAAIEAAGVKIFDEGLQLQPVAMDAFEQQLPTPRPGAHAGVQHGAQYQWEPAAIKQFDRAACHEQQVNSQEEHGGQQRDRQGHLPGVAHYKESEDGRDRHGQRHCDPVGRGQGRGAAKMQHRGNHRQQQQPVDRGDVDLAGFARRGVVDRHARQKAQLHGLLGHGIGT